MQIQDKVIIITGASSGIGLATSKYLASRGAKVVLAARSVAKLEELEKGLPGSLAVPTDVTKERDIKNLVDKTLERFGRIDILINNAALAMFNRLENIIIDDYRKVLELNVIAPLALMQAVIPTMHKQGGGMIVNMSSASTRFYIPNIAGYASSKYALNALSLTAREELKDDKIIVSIIRPRLVETDFGKHGTTPEPDFLRHEQDGSVKKEVLMPEEVAKKIGELIETEIAELDLLPTNH